MSLVDALQEGPYRAARRTFPETMRDRLPDDEYVALVALLHDPGWPAAQIARLLQQEHSITVSASTIKTYRAQRSV